MQFFGYRNRPAAEAAAHGQAAPAAEADIKAAYQRGRQDERIRRRRSPLVTLAIAVVAAVGAGVIGLAAYEGSFSRGGEVVDQKLAVAADQAVVTGRDAASAAGEAARDASQSLRNSTDRAG